MSVWTRLMPVAAAAALAIGLGQPAAAQGIAGSVKEAGELATPVGYWYDPPPRYVPGPPPGYYYAPPPPRYYAPPPRVYYPPPPPPAYYYPPPPPRYYRPPPPGVGLYFRF